MHKKNVGKIDIISKVKTNNEHDLSLAYSPGVAEPCRIIAKNPEELNTYTARGNMIAVVSDGSAVLGLGNIGARAALPVMEYVEGESLKEIIEKKGPLPPETIADYAIQISSALLTAHKNNLIHRDIKPQNILVTPEEKVKVTDFGIAKSLTTDVTKTLNIMGTAHYISPEQAKGEV
ncbi:unnamed protein product, partial [marine sediment metagenome]